MLDSASLRQLPFNESIQESCAVDLLEKMFCERPRRRPKVAGIDLFDLMTGRLLEDWRPRRVVLDHCWHQDVIEQRCWKMWEGRHLVAILRDRHSSLGECSSGIDYKMVRNRSATWNLQSFLRFLFVLRIPILGQVCQDDSNLDGVVGHQFQKVQIESKMGL
jgi:hypothetical protein